MRASLAVGLTRQKPCKNTGFVKKPWGGPQGFRQTCPETKVICSFGIAGWANCVTNEFRAQAVSQKGFAAQVVTERVAGKSRRRTRRRRHLVARRGPNLASSWCVWGLRGRKRFKMETWSWLPVSHQAFQALGVRANCVTNGLRAQSRRRMRRRAKSSQTASPGRLVVRTLGN